MGDISDGSSGAASDAQTEGSKTTERGFIGRFFDAFGADKDAPPQSADDVHIVYPKPSPTMPVAAKDAARSYSHGLGHR